jgi:hypothetical protein
MKTVSMGISRRAVIGGAIALAASAGTGFGSARHLTRLQLRRGVNLFPWFSLTREYQAPSTDYAWPPFQADRTIPSQDDLVRLRQTGLDFVRIPIDPGPFLAATKSQKASLTDSLFDAVGQALDAGLSVVLNIQANTATHYWTQERLLADTSAPGFPAYRALVGDFAARLGRLDPARVALEPVNEPLQECSSSVWSNLQMELLKAARKAAPDLTLVATGACGSMPAGFAALDPAPLDALQPLLFTFHFYEPYVFSHQGAPWMSEPIYRWLNSVPWPASTGTLEATLEAVRSRMNEDTQTPPDAKPAIFRETEKALQDYFDGQPDRSYLDNFLLSVSQWRDRNGIAPHSVYLGEFGALRSDARYVAAHAPDRARYLRDVRESAESFGFPWAMWDLFDGMGMMDDVTREFDPSVLDALGLDAGTR